MALLLACCLTFLVPTGKAFAVSSKSLQVSPDSNGIRIVANDVELYFNKTNGGEITEYFDLTVDPSRSRNLVNIRWKPWENLLPLFTSLFYKPPNATLVLSTGGDTSAMLWLASNTSEYVILQSSSRIMGKAGEISKDIYGNNVYVNSTWIIRATGLISVERAFVSSSATFASGWRWYPFYLTRTASSNYNLTFYMFNTTYAYSSIVNPMIYRDTFSSFSPIPNDTRHIFGVALPFANISIGGDGSHNMLIAYKYDELVDVDQWKSDNFYSTGNNITEGGAVYEFGKATNISTHTYHMIINCTHQSIDEESLKSFASYCADNMSIALPMECSITTDKDLYKPGDCYSFYGSGTVHYDFTRLTARFSVTNSSGWIMYRRDYGPGNVTANQTFKQLLLNGIVSSNPGNYTSAFQIFSQYGIIISSSSKTITVSVP